MAAITISRQLGSLGDEVAQAIAERLKYRVVSRDVINQAAICCGTPEIALALIDDLGLFGIRISTKDRNDFLETIKKFMDELAAQGGVIIVGRAGQIILRDHPNVLHVKVIAPAFLRAKRIAALLNISIDAAKAQIQASDRSRRSYLKKFYHARWDDPELYDLIVNTARLEPSQAACLVCQIMEQCFQTNKLNANIEQLSTNG